MGPRRTVRRCDVPVRFALYQPPLRICTTLRPFTEQRSNFGRHLDAADCARMYFPSRVFHLVSSGLRASVYKTTKGSRISPSLLKTVLIVLKVTVLDSSIHRSLPLISPFCSTPRSSSYVLFLFNVNCNVAQFNPSSFSPSTFDHKMSERQYTSMLKGFGKQSFFAQRDEPSQLISFQSQMTFLCSQWQPSHRQSQPGQRKSALVIIPNIRRRILKRLMVRTLLQSDNPLDTRRKRSKVSVGRTMVQRDHQLGTRFH